MHELIKCETAACVLLSSKLIRALWSMVLRGTNRQNMFFFFFFCLKVMSDIITVHLNFLVHDPQHRHNVLYLLHFPYPQVAGSNATTKMDYFTEHGL